MKFCLAPNGFVFGFKTISLEVVKHVLATRGQTTPREPQSGRRDPALLFHFQFPQPQQKTLKTSKNQTTAGRGY